MRDEPGDALADRRRTAMLIVVLQLFFAAATVPIWAALALMKLDDASVAEQRLIDAAILGYPLALLLAVVMSWRAWQAGKMTAAVRWNLPPLAWVAGLAVASVG